MSAGFIRDDSIPSVIWTLCQILLCDVYCMESPVCFNKYLTETPHSPNSQFFCAKLVIEKMKGLLQNY